MGFCLSIAKASVLWPKAEVISRILGIFSVCLFSIWINGFGRVWDKRRNEQTEGALFQIETDEVALKVDGLDFEDVKD